MDHPLIQPPCVLHEDDHLLVVQKPSGWNTHAPAPHAGEGIFDWLRHREPRWANLSILHRLDKDTSGLLVFGKSPLANQSLTQQFTDRTVLKRYRLWVRHRPVKPEWTATTALVRAGDRYVSRPIAAGSEVAETSFREISPVKHSSGIYWEIEATPHTGRTHQIRVHAADAGCPILGDTLYSGASFPRLCLHAAELQFTHPNDGRSCQFRCAPEFAADPGAAMRAAFIDDAATNAFRQHHGAADGVPGCYLEKLGDFQLIQSAVRSPLPLTVPSTANLYQKILRRDVRQTTTAETSPIHVQGRIATEPFCIRENGVRFELSLQEGYSVGLFLDQRDNRRRLLNHHIAAGFPLRAGHPNLAGTEMLNAFAYTCGFSVCAGLAGARTTSLDLSRKYLDWGRRNFVHNGLDPAGHDFIYGDCFDWMKRLTKKGRSFDLIVLDPPTFSRSKEQGDFRAEHDYGHLVQTTLPLLKPGGLLLASTNALRLEPTAFLGQIHAAVARAGRRLLQEHYVPQPADFPISRDEPAYLKTVWCRIS